MHTMSREEWRAFLLDGTRTAKVATVRADGRPHVTPVWFDLDGDDLVFTTASTSLKGRHLARDRRVSLCVDDERKPYSFVMIEGEVSLEDDLDALRAWATRIGGRYMGKQRAKEYGARNGVPGEVLVRVRARRVVAQAAIAD